MLTVEEYNRRLEATRICADCPMMNKGIFVGADSSSGLVEKRNIMFLGLNPGTEEARLGRPFVGPSGRFLRKYLEQADIRDWAMANSLLCSTANEREIISPDRSRQSCRCNLTAIFKSFSPQIIVPCGNGAWSVFETGMGISSAANYIFISRGRSGKSQPALVLPLVHPSALIRSGGASSPRFAQFFDRLGLIGRLGRLVASSSLDSAIEWIKQHQAKLLSCFPNKPYA